jgi:MFS transporter, DHA2 family, multidrug resistance protein
MTATSEEQVSLRTWIAVLGTLLGAFMAVLDIQITNASLREITGGIASTAVEASWVSTSYLIGEIITIPLTAWLGRVFGTRLYLLVNVFWRKGKMTIGSPAFSSNAVLRSQ